MAAAGIPLTRPRQFDRFLHASIGPEGNDMDLSVLSVLARVGKDPWIEAARLAGLPRAAAADSLAATFADLPAGSRPRAQARMIAHRLVPLLPDQDHPVPDTKADGSRRVTCMGVMLLASAMLSAALVLGLLVGVTIWVIPHADLPTAPAGPVGASRPSPVGQPGQHRGDLERPDRATLQPSMQLEPRLIKRRLTMAHSGVAAHHGGAARWA